MAFPFRASAPLLMRVPPLSMLVAAYGLLSGDASLSDVAVTDPLIHVPAPRLLMPCEAPWCTRWVAAPVSDLHRPAERNSVDEHHR